VKVLFTIISFCFVLIAQRMGNRYIRLALSEHCKTLIINKTDNQEIYAKIFFGDNENFHDFISKSDSLSLQWSIKNNPDEIALHSDSVILNTAHFKLNKDNIELHFSIPKLSPNVTQFLTLKFYNNNNQQGYVMFERITNTDHITFPFYVKKNSSPFPLLEQFCNENDTLSFSTTKNDSILVEYVSQTDSLALPPMYLGMNPYILTKNYQIFKIGANTKWIPAKTGLYVFSYSGDKAKFSIVVHNSKFPTFTKARELIKALSYITTNEERATLLGASNPKEALDEFLINLTGDQNLAKNIIKSYFKRVTEANQFFTTNKEGWKTDKGMIYIIFGAPDKVYFENGHEDWSYEKNPLYNELNFYFQHQYTDQGIVYELERLKDYQKIWISITEKWRKGLIK
jgi:GWxTD domain-containing protein